MQLQRFVKSFSQGQITIPKDFRDQLQLGNDFWLKLSLDTNRIIAEAAIKSPTPHNYTQKLLQVKGKWFNPQDWQGVREEVTARLRGN
ncbi:MAG: hypothetical protein A2784_03590 [Candidatus Chisholmbacteria bacterium RIFCSPHIGHO2_01_FULL_48_12]|uniref:SpoVT-AbrB domain-containing protein n=1 Tax=Candidatus Chisholmbacteria bacterium RIFCSPHIGHO2_01_FULL_48_12 TaxID=1797589 RepID=A0A1G1VQ05_9BACT|nr:MAG: hypothetical protein A2784_03590 [Candidatus Chisholmbacteria bacterium RIFCSPHIGHO2_01_FULL_48_12]